MSRVHAVTGHDHRSRPYRHHLTANKRAMGRPQDLLDADLLERS
jgi:hypothetical protein